MAGVACTRILNVSVDISGDQAFLEMQTPKSASCEKQNFLKLLLEKPLPNSNDKILKEIFMKKLRLLIPSFIVSLSFLYLLHTQKIGHP